VKIQNIEKRSAEARRLLVELRALLESEGEANWRRGLESAIACLSDGQGNLDPQGFEDARSIYKTMTSGGRGFAEYYIVRPSETDQIRANESLEDLRSRVWSAFDL
jgi:hypothetical protein